MKKATKIIAGIALSIVVVVAVYLMVYMVVDRYNHWHDKRTIESMAEGVKSLKDSLAKNDMDMQWIDESGCTVIKPRLFGDKTEYFCTKQYTATKAIASQDSINRLIDQQVSTLLKNTHAKNIETTGHYPTYTTDKVILQQPETERLSQLSSRAFTLEGVAKQGGCGMDYKLTTHSESDSVYLDMNIGCRYSALDAYYEPLDYI